MSVADINKKLRKIVCEPKPTGKMSGDWEEVYPSSSIGDKRETRQDKKGQTFGIQEIYDTDGFKFNPKPPEEFISAKKSCVHVGAVCTSTDPRRPADK